jgi:FkbM family methyltransferase
MKSIFNKAKAVKHGIGQRLYYVGQSRHGFSLVLLLPGSLRERIKDNLFFRTVTKHIKEIKLTNFGSYSILNAGWLTLKFPKGCFYEGDFFDIIFPNLGINDKKVDALVYHNPYYRSEGRYEEFGVQLADGDYVIDAGANIGMFSTIASRKVGETGKVFAFEPMKEISAILEENKKTNNCKNIVIENYLLGETSKKVDFYFNLESNYNGASKTLHGEGDKVMQLEQITLDEYVEKNNLQTVSFIKADIEGAERDLLGGATKTLQKFKPKLALRTYHLPDDRALLPALVKEAVPEYTIRLHKETLYAWIEEKA